MIGSSSNFSNFIEKKLGREAGSGDILTGSGSSGLDTPSSSSSPLSSKYSHSHEYLKDSGHEFYSYSNLSKLNR